MTMCINTNNSWGEGGGGGIMPIYSSIFGLMGMGIDELPPIHVYLFHNVLLTLKQQKHFCGLSVFLPLKIYLSGVVV